MSEPPLPRKAGRPAFQPTDEQRRQVEAMIGFGIPEAEIARLVVNPQTNRPVDEKTLRLHFRSEIDTGQVKANAAVAQSLFRQAVGGNVTAAIFWLKTRMGWKETSAVEMSGGAVAPSIRISIVGPEERAPTTIEQINEHREIPARGRQPLWPTQRLASVPAK
jgi:hypothetical protein